MSEQDVTAHMCAPNSPIPFDFEGSSVRLIDSDGALWFILADVCKVLEIGNPSDAARRLDDDEKMTLDNTEGHSGQRGGAQTFTIINESGLYSLILRSRKPEAKRFKKWVTAEVLPSIRKTGGYGIDAATNERPIGGDVPSEARFREMLNELDDEALGRLLAQARERLTPVLPAPEARDGPPAPTAFLSSDITARLDRRARQLCEASIPRLRDELARLVVRNLYFGQPLDIENDTFRVSTLRRYQPGSEEEATHQIGEWAWEILPDGADFARREKLKAAIAGVLRGSAARRAAA